MSRRKKNDPGMRFAAGGQIPKRDPLEDDYHQKPLEQMRLAMRPVTVSFSTASMFTNGPTAASKFSGSEFSMGTAVGVRSWDVDKLGRLQSPSYKTIWTPNEMVASCKSDPFSQLNLGYATRSEGEHQQSSCSCGFYAYYEGNNEYAAPERITGVIEGYGETQIGTRGFKSAKARIVALFVPDDSADIRRIGKTAFARVRENYGQHVAIFSDYAQMAAEYPTTRPENATPVTPETDPDFWTRDI